MAATETQTNKLNQITGVESIETKTEVFCLEVGAKRNRVIVGKTWNELKWLVQDDSEWRKFVCAFASQGVERGGGGGNYL